VTKIVKWNSNNSKSKIDRPRDNANQNLDYKPGDMPEANRTDEKD
jgi:hypothetical protein